MANSTLDAIRTKVRRLTRSPSPQHLTNDNIDEYVNTFVLYDFPMHLRLFSLRAIFTFYTDPYIDTYENSTDATSDFYQFKDKCISLHPPIYVAGNEIEMSQSRDEFFRQYPLTNSIRQEATGNGALTIYTGTLSSIPVLRNQVTFSSVDIVNNGIVLHDDGDGNLDGNGTGTIDYVTGEYTLQFSAAPKSGVAINSETVPYVTSRPQALLYFNNKITLRPVPDQPYKVDIEAYVRPTALIASNQSPDLEQWWQYIAYGAAKKIFEDRTDSEGVSAIMPEFKAQEELVLSRVISQLTNERYYQLTNER